ncbi:MAG: helix-turn-helix transcriptional regulator [Bacteroidota bacterium]
MPIPHFHHLAGVSFSPDPASRGTAARMPVFSTPGSIPPQLPVVLWVGEDQALYQKLRIAIQDYCSIRMLDSILRVVEYMLTHPVPELIILDHPQFELYSSMLSDYLRQSDRFSNIHLLILLPATAGEVPPLPYPAVHLHLVPSPVNLEHLRALIMRLLGHVPLTAARDKSGVPHSRITAPRHANEQKWLDGLDAVVDKLLPQFNLTLQEVADQMCMSLPHLHRKIKQVAGLTAMQYIREKRLLKSRAMLEQNPHTYVKVVAHSVGYKSAKNFSKLFQIRFGRTPSSYLQR